MAKLNAEQLTVVSPVVKDNAASATDKKLVELVKTQTGVEVTLQNVRETRQALGIRKTRGRNSRVLAEGEVQVIKRKAEAPAPESVVDQVV